MKISKLIFIVLCSVEGALIIVSWMFPDHFAGAALWLPDLLIRAFFATFTGTLSGLLCWLQGDVFGNCTMFRQERPLLVGVLVSVVTIILVRNYQPIFSFFHSLLQKIAYAYYCIFTPHPKKHPPLIAENMSKPMATDDPSGKKPKVEYLPPLKPLDPLPPITPTTKRQSSLSDFLPTLPGVQVRGFGLFEGARLKRLTNIIDLNRRGYEAVTKFWESRDAAVRADMEHRKTLERHDDLTKDDNEQFKFEMEQRARQRQQTRKQWNEEDNPKPVVEPPKPLPEDPMAKHRQAMHDNIMLPKKIRAEAEQFIYDEIITKRGGVHKLTDEDRQEIEDIREQVEAYIASLRERGS